MNKQEILDRIELLKNELKYGTGEESDFFELGMLYEKKLDKKGKYKKQNFQTILDCYNQAIEQNTYYIPAVQKKATFVCNSPYVSDETISDIKKEIETVLKIYPANAELQATLGQIKIFCLKDKEGGLDNIKKAAELDKSYEGLLKAANNIEDEQQNLDVFLLKKQSKTQNNFKKLIYTSLILLVLICISLICIKIL